jgi:hypothetical protein
MCCSPEDSLVLFPAFSPAVVLRGKRLASLQSFHPIIQPVPARSIESKEGYKLAWRGGDDGIEPSVRGVKAGGICSVFGRSRRYGDLIADIVDISMPWI